jgi:hypothetical protein
MSQVILNKLVDDILDGNNLDAQQTFEDAISIKITDALNQRKADIAQSIYSNQEESEEQETESEDE